MSLKWTAREAARLWEQADAFRTDGEEAVEEMRTEIFRSGFLAGLYREPAYTDFTEIIRSVQNKFRKKALRCRRHMNGSGNGTACSVLLTAWIGLNCFSRGR